MMSSLILPMISPESGCSLIHITESAISDNIDVVGGFIRVYIDNFHGTITDCPLLVATTEKEQQ
ncbi:MAG: hypothetical protein LBR49_00960 [Tannerella sp.]|nr:hypothetical protein [Tannerella sp.]